MLVLIFIQIVLVIFCITFAIKCFSDDMPGWGALMIFWAVINGILCADNIQDLGKEDQLQKFEVSNVKEYSIDSTMVINGADTTKTYVITYWK